MPASCDRRSRIFLTVSWTALVSRSGSFSRPAILGLSQGILMFSTMIFQATHPPGGALPDFGLASGYAMVQLVASIGLITLYGRMVRNSAQFSVITGKAYRPHVIALGRLRYPACVAAAAYFIDLEFTFHRDPIVELCEGLLRRNL